MHATSPVAGGTGGRSAFARWRARMIPGKFDYHAPADVPAAIALLQQFGDEAKVLAGGQSLIPMMRFRLAEPAHLIDIGGIAGLAGIDDRDGWLRIGAMTREADVEQDERIA